MQDSQRYMNKIEKHIFKIWNFLPLSQMLFLWLNKTPPKWDPPLSVQEGFDISFLKYYFLPPLEHNKILIWNWSIENLISKNFLKKLGGGAVLLLWANTISPLAWIAKNGYLWVKYKPFYFLPNGKQVNMSEDYTKVERWRNTGKE